MPMKLYDSMEAAPEALRAAAIETKDGKFAVDEPDLGDGGKAAIEAERKKAKDALKRADELQAKLDEAASEKEATDKGISKEALDKIRADEALKAKPMQEENEKLKGQLRKVQLDDRVQSLLLKAGVMPDRITKAMRDLAPGANGRVDLTEDGDGIVVRDANGNITTETIEDFVGKTYKTESPFFYTGTNASGSGAEAGSGDAGSGGGYDPVAAGRKAAALQKKTAEDNALAFK